MKRNNTLRTMGLTYVLGSLLIFSALTSFGQQDPAVVIPPVLAPATPLAGVGAPFTITFSIGNAGPTAISGTGVNNANRMQFGISLGKAAASPASAAALSGSLLTYFDVVYTVYDDGSTGYEGRQKQNTVIPGNTFYTLVLQAVVTVASTDATVNDIGASINISPNGNSSPQNGANDFTSAYTHTVVAMPVSLVWFKAEAQPDQTVAVSWQTSMESGNKGYVVERSKDLTSFELVGNVTDVAGTSSSLNTYGLRDASPYRGTSYYRLRQVDLSGSSRTYAAVAVSLDGVYGVYPNPISGRGFTLSLDEPTTALVQFYTASGRPVAFTRETTGAGSLTLKPVESISAGMYLLRVEERAQVRTYRLVVP